MSSIRASRLALLAGAGLLAAQAARAQPAAKDSALAETLFEDAKKNMATGDYASACPKLAESYRLDPGSGTLTALAVCDEEIGKTASAWAEFMEVIHEAQRVGRLDRVKFARQRAEALEPGLSRLTITVLPETARLPNIQVTRDNVVVGPSAWGVASPVDAGDHVIEASAPGKLTWSTHVSVGPSADREAVRVPVLEDAVSSDAVAAAPSIGADAVELGGTAQPIGSPGNSQRVAGIVAASAGLISLGAGALFGVEAIAKSDDAKQMCSPSACTDVTAVEENSKAKADALFADITLGAGLVAVGVGTYLLLAAPAGGASSARAQAGAERRVRLVPWVGRYAAGLGAQTGW